MQSFNIIEDIANAMDINKLKPAWPKIWTVGNFAKETDETESVGETMIGLGFLEVLAYVLTSPAVVSNNVQSVDGKVVQLLKPRMTAHTGGKGGRLPSL